MKLTIMVQVRRWMEKSNIDASNPGDKPIPLVGNCKTVIDEQATSNKSKPESLQDQQFHGQDRVLVDSSSSAKLHDRVRVGLMQLLANEQSCHTDINILVSQFRQVRVHQYVYSVVMSLGTQVQCRNQVSEQYAQLWGRWQLFHWYFNDVNQFYNILQPTSYQIRYLMIPCRVFLQKLQITPPSACSHKPKISLILNSIYYDQIKPFQTKYFCLTSNDVVGIQAMLELENGEDYKLAGGTDIENAFRLALESQTVEIDINVGNKMGIKEIKLTLCFEPVSAYSKKMLDTSSEGATKRVDRMFEEDFRNSSANNQINQLQISFSHREPRDAGDVYSTMNLTKDFKIRDTFRDVPLFPESHRSMPDQAESLQSLAQQRQKILGELFGRFKPIK